MSDKAITSKNVIFYFSGTGNSYLVAKKIEEQLKDACIFNIFEYSAEKISCSNVIVVFPVWKEK